MINGTRKASQNLTFTNKSSQFCQVISGSTISSLQINIDKKKGDPENK